MALKPSGVDWLGDVPAHWEVKRAKYAFVEIDQRSADGSEVHLSMSQRLGLVPSQDLLENHTISASYAGGKLCQTSDLVLNRLKAHLGVFAMATTPGVISPDYTVFRSLRGAHPKFFELMLKSPIWRYELRRRVQGIVEGLWRLYTDDFYQILLPFPPKQEQQEILAGIAESSREIDAIIDRARREIDLIREYRTRLIADVVTGKIDVRGHPDAAENNEGSAGTDDPVEVDGGMEEDTDLGVVDADEDQMETE